MIDIKKKYLTRSGKEVRIFCTDLDESERPVVGTIAGEIHVSYWTQQGEYGHPESPHDFDLIEVRKPREFKLVQLSGETFMYDEGDENNGWEVIRVREIID